MSGNENKLFVLAAPSGAGKTTLVHALVKRNPALKFSISYTTRTPRENEIHGRDYFFVTADEFLELQEKGELLESACVFDNHYGTSRSQVEQHLQHGDGVLLEIDWQGAQQVREAMPEAVTVFVIEKSRRIKIESTNFVWPCALIALALFLTEIFIRRLWENKMFR